MIRPLSTALFLALATQTHASVLFTLDYESGTIDSGANIKTADAPATDSIQLSTAPGPTRSGNYAIRHKVNLDDPDYVSSGKPRSESSTSPYQIGRYQSGDHLRYNFSFYLEDWVDWNGTSKSIDIIWQFKKTGDGPDMHIGVKRNALVVLRGNAQTQLISDIRSYDNKWIDLQIDVLWSSLPNGTVDIGLRHEGELSFSNVLSVDNYQTYSTEGGQFGYLKWGLYRPNSDSVERGDTVSRTIYHDDISVSTLSVPEPSSTLLIASSLLSFCLFYRTR